MKRSSKAEKQKLQLLVSSFLSLKSCQHSPRDTRLGDREARMVARYILMAFLKAKAPGAIDE